MTRAGLFSSGALAAFAFLVAGVACVDNDPIVTGHRDAAAPTPTGTVEAGPAPFVPQTITPGIDFDGGVDDDDPKCRQCAETLDTNNARGTLCRKNSVDDAGVSSVQLLNSLVNCVCFGGCSDKCSSYCAGAQATSTCQLCIQSQCGDQAIACKADIRK